MRFLKAESQVCIYMCMWMHTCMHAVEALTDRQVEGSAREFRIEIEFFAPGTALNERECAKPPAGQQCARLATGGSITIAGAIPILCSV